MFPIGVACFGPDLFKRTSRRWLTNNLLIIVLTVMLNTLLINFLTHMCSTELYLLLGTLSSLRRFYGVDPPPPWSGVTSSQSVTQYPVNRSQGAAWPWVISPLPAVDPQQWPFSAVICCVETVWSTAKWVFRPYVETQHRTWGQQLINIRTITSLTQSAVLVLFAQAFCCMYQDRHVGCFVTL